MASLRSKFEEHLTCSVCLEQLKDPKVLPCLHSFCHKCIVNIAKKGKSNNINCPECRKLVQLDNPDNPSNLPSNFFVNNLLATMALTDEEKEQKIQCDNCTDENSAATRCEECAVFLCSYCSEFHRKSRGTKHHLLTTLQELKSGVGPLRVAEKIRCQKHKDEMIKLYCKTCQVTICRDCTIVEHRTHDYGFIEDVAVGQKDILKRNMNEVQQRKATLQRAIASLRQFDQSLVEENALVVAQITSHFDELTRIMMAKNNELVLKAKSITSMKRKQVQAQIEALEVALTSCNSSIEFTEKAFKNGNDVQVLSMQKYMLQSLQDLKEVKDVTQPCVTRDLMFTIPWTIQDTTKNFMSFFAVYESVTEPGQCQAEFTDQDQLHLKRGQQASVRITCFTKNKNKVNTGGQTIQANISGVECDDNIKIQDNKDGTHTVNFIPRHGGALKIEATINGHPAPGCSLTKDVAWVFSSAYGSGEIYCGSLKLTSNNVNQGSGWRIGESSFKSGVHTWKVLIKHEDSHDQAWQEQYGYFHRNYNYGHMAVCDVGVVGNTNCRPQFSSRLQFAAGEEATVTVTLNIPDGALHLESDKNVHKVKKGKSLQCKDEKDGTKEVINIHGEQFWPYFRCHSTTVVVLKWD
ncbi:tripartite motif-containing protein 45-like [Dendronephthya gigantea]|uniref:tripartite motif-containing protein 45-like n=1 Tax=Dendronephthya gigantea TaxID=151771 RepID=UPI00106BE2C5|nr:tripartite motif-containing protein 45-like [Dendronephthya gigantea]